MVINYRDSGSPSNRFVRTVQNKRAFTLVELILVMALIGVLATLSFNEFENIKTRVRTARCIEEIRGIEKEIIAYTTDKGTNPPDLTTIGWGAQLDPWGHNYVYGAAGLRKNGAFNINTDFDLYSKGADGNTAVSISSALVSYDDIIRANDGAFAGTAKDFML